MRVCLCVCALYMCVSMGMCVCNMYVCVCTVYMCVCTVCVYARVCTVRVCNVRVCTVGALAVVSKPEPVGSRPLMFKAGVHYFAYYAE